MKNIIIIIGLVLFSTILNAQTQQEKSDDMGRIVLAAYVSEQVDGLTPAAQSSLTNKLSQIVTNNGMGGDIYNCRFIITANVVVATKDITPTAPPMHAYTLQVTLYIGDGIEGTLFSSTTVTLKGVGETETKAYNMALKNLRVDDPKYAAFIEKGKGKIIDYYNAKCEFIMKDAEMLANKGEFDAGINKLIAVPDASQNCYNKAIGLIGVIFQKKIDFECDALISKAKGAWSASQDLAGGREAVEYLQQINPQSKCYKDANSLVDFYYNEIKKRVKDLDDREWKFMQKMQQDDVDIRKQTISAARDVGVAYGKNQPRTTYNVRGWY